jgi:hypothetical protein
VAGSAFMAGCMSSRHRLSPLLARAGSNKFVPNHPLYKGLQVSDETSEAGDQGCLAKLPPTGGYEKI